MSSEKKSGWQVIGPEPWRVESLRDYDGPPLCAGARPWSES